MISCCKYFYNDTWGDQRRNWNSLNVLGDGHNEFRIFQMVQFMDNSSHCGLLQRPHCIIWYLLHKLLKSQRESFYFMTTLSKHYWSPKYISVSHCYETKRKRKTSIESILNSTCWQWILSASIILLFAFSFLFDSYWVNELKVKDIREGELFIITYVK